MIKPEQEYRGVMLATMIGLTAYVVSGYLPSAFNSILTALLFGMLAGNFIKFPDSFQSGISLTSGKMLELSIIFLAFSINFTHITKLGATGFSIIAIVVFLILLITYFLAHRVNCPGSTGWLVGFGTAICGSSAIAALAPSVAKNKDDVAIAMAVVNLFGSLGMIALPALLLKFHLTPDQMGLILGGSLHSVGNVAGAGYTLGNHIGETAITFKLARVALLSPGLIFFNYLVNRGQNKNWWDYFRLPWYLWSFIAITIISSFVIFPVDFLSFMESTGKIVLTIAMAAIGLKVRFSDLFKSGKKGLVFGILIFFIQLSFVFLFMNVFKVQ